MERSRYISDVKYDLPRHRLGHASMNASGHSCDMVKLFLMAVVLLQL